MYSSYKKDMQVEDVFRLRKEDEVASNFDQFQENWERRQTAYNRWDQFWNAFSWVSMFPLLRELYGPCAAAPNELVEAILVTNLTMT